MDTKTPIIGINELNICLSNKSIDFIIKTGPDKEDIKIGIIANRINVITKNIEPIMILLYSSLELISISINLTK